MQLTVRWVGWLFLSALESSWFRVPRSFTFCIHTLYTESGKPYHAKQDFLSQESQLCLAGVSNFLKNHSIYFHVRLHPGMVPHCVKGQGGDHVGRRAVNIWVFAVLCSSTKEWHWQFRSTVIAVPRPHLWPRQDQRFARELHAMYEHFDSLDHCIEQCTIWLLTFCISGTPIISVREVIGPGDEFAFLLWQWRFRKAPRHMNTSLLARKRMSFADCRWQKGDVDTPGSLAPSQSISQL